MSIDAVVLQVRELLARAHTLFADPATSGAATAAASGARMADAGQRLQAGADHAAPLSGRLADGHGQFTDAAGAELSALAGSDGQLGQRLGHAAATQHRGIAASTAAIAAATGDTAALAPLIHTPAGQEAVLRALRDRVAQQQRIIADTQADAAAAAAAMRALTYPSADGGPNIGATT